MFYIKQAFARFRPPGAAPWGRPRALPRNPRERPAAPFGDLGGRPLEAVGSGLRSSKPFGIFCNYYGESKLAIQESAVTTDGQDSLVRATAADGQVRCMAAVTTRTAAEAARRHGTSGTVAAALGRTLTGAALLGAWQKE